MAFEQFSDWTTQISLEKIFSGDFSVLLPILYLVIAIAIYSVLIYHFYRFIARRDCLKVKSMKHPRAVEFLKYFFLFPFIAFLFFVGFSLMLLFLTKNYDMAALLSTSFAIIVAIRFTAYYNEDLSRDVAKMLPFALLGLFLVDPSYFSWGDITAKVTSVPNFLDLCIQYILFIIIIEWVLRLLFKLRYRLFPKKQKPVVV